MLLNTMVLPLEGGSPSSVMVVVFSDAVMLLYGDKSEDDFLKIDKGNMQRFTFDRHPYMREIINADGAFNLIKLLAFVNMEKRL